jgi:DNA-binding transcriptional ArsR family regulator
MTLDRDDPHVDAEFAALVDGTRRDILRRAMAGDEGVSELAAHYAMSFAAVQKHIAVLERAGLVTKHQIGRRKVVRTRMDGLRQAQDLLDQFEELWRGRLERMANIISETEEKPT